MNTPELQNREPLEDYSAYVGDLRDQEEIRIPPGLPFESASARAFRAAGLGYVRVMYCSGYSAEMSDSEVALLSPNQHAE